MNTAKDSKFNSSLIMNQEEVEGFNKIIQILVGSSYLPWYHLIELCTVSKEFQAKIDYAFDTNQLLDWDNMLRMLNAYVNRTHICHYTEKDFIDCDDDDCYKNQSHDWFDDDPRQNDDFYSSDITSYKKFIMLMKFHKQCIENLFSFFPVEDLSTPVERTEWFWPQKGLRNFKDMNKGMHALMFNVCEMALALADLASPSGSYFYRQAFQGIECDPNTGSLWTDDMMETVDSMICSYPPKKSGDKVIVPGGIFGDQDYYASQLLSLDKSIMKWVGIETEENENETEKKNSKAGPYNEGSIEFEDSLKQLLQSMKKGELKTLANEMGIKTTYTVEEEDKEKAKSKEQLAKDVLKKKSFDDLLQPGANTNANANENANANVNANAKEEEPTIDILDNKLKRQFGPLYGSLHPFNSKEFQANIQATINKLPPLKLK